MDDSLLSKPRSRPPASQPRRSPDLDPLQSAVIRGYQDTAIHALCGRLLGGGPRQCLRQRAARRQQWLRAHLFYVLQRSGHARFLFLRQCCLAPALDLGYTAFRSKHLV